MSDSFELYLRLPGGVIVNDAVRCDSSADLFRLLESEVRIRSLVIAGRAVHPVSVGALNAYRRLFGVRYFLRRVSPHRARSRHTWHGLLAHLGMLDAQNQPL